MDWTGGVRRRFAGGKNSGLLQKQRAHFAKARAALQNAPSSHHLLPPMVLNDLIGRSSPFGTHRRHADSYVSRPRTGPSVDRHQRRGASSLTSSRRSKLHHSHTQHKPVGKRQHTSPSVVLISSSTPSSSAPSTRNGVSPENTGLEANVQPVPSDRSTHEEGRLSAKRRELLARADWLGLAPSRPLHRKALSARDRDRIGKRRKLESFDRLAKPTSRRPLSPLFNERLPQPEYLMSGALPEESIRIKIGTDALASQTQRSRQSRTLAPTSMRHLSTDFDTLSEESMLLGADGDSFETAGRFRGMDYERLAIPFAPSIALRPISPTNAANHYVTDSPVMRLPPNQSGEADSEHFLRGAASDGDLGGTYGHVEDVTGTPTHNGLVRHEMYDRRASGAAPPRSRDGLHDTHITILQRSAATSHADDEDEDEIWRRLMGIHQDSSSHASLAALRSSSQHITDSGSSHRPVLHQDQDHNDNTQMPDVSTPQGSGTHVAATDAPTWGGNQNRGSLQSPSASLRDIIRLAKQPAQHRGQEAIDDSDDDALWRHFVFGSHEGDRESSKSVDIAQMQDDGNNKQEPARSVLPKSIATGKAAEIGTVALGKTLFVTDSTPSSLRQKFITQRAELPSDEEPQSSVLQASTIAQPEELYGRDSVENAEAIRTDTRQPYNIHASPTSLPKPKQFKRVVAPAHKSSLVPKAGMARTLNETHSVYDLVDSDGISLT